MAAESLRHLRLAFLGSQSITAALIERLVSSGTLPPSNILVTDTQPERLAELRQRFAIVASLHTRDATSFASLIFLSTPPGLVETVLAELRDCLAREQLIISLVAGLPTAAIEERLGRAVAVVRAAPSLACLVGAGVIPYCLGKNATVSDQARLAALLSVFGSSSKVREDQMNAATIAAALAPGYILPVIKTLMQSAARNGLSGAEARSLIAGMLRGTAELLAETKEELDTLKLKIGPGLSSEKQLCAFFAEAFDTAMKKLAGEEEKTTAAAA